MIDDEIKADLEAKVKELLDDIVVMGMAKLAHLEASGANISGDHKDATWATPKNFISAFAEEIKWQYQPPRSKPDAGMETPHQKLLP